ncbi:Protein F53F4.11 [Aphelenchoides avenae]|nr:Protein F53F4.11 [Aphelenchus avenae]
MARGKNSARKGKATKAAAGKTVDHPARSKNKTEKVPALRTHENETNSDSEIELDDIGTKKFFQEVVESSDYESDASEQSLKSEQDADAAETKEDGVRKFEIKSQARVALKALQKYRKENSKKLLFPELDESVFFVIKYKKPALKGSGIRRRFIRLPCTDRNPDNTSICLILPDLDRSEKAMKDPDVDKQAREWSDKLLEEYGITPQDVSKIFTFRQLEREYSDEADRKKLSTTYDIFMVDSALMKKALWLLGANFMKPGKLPLPINANRKKAVKQIANAYQTVNFSTEPLKDTVSVRIGHLGQSIVDLSDNLNEVVDRVAQYAPGGLLNCRACYIQTSDTSLSLPVYADFGSANDVKLEAPVKAEYDEEEDECSTLPEGLAVRVRKDGQVVVIDAKTKQEVIYPTMDDEWEEGDDIQPLNVAKVAKKRLREAKRKRTSAGEGSTTKPVRETKQEAKDSAEVAKLKTNSETKEEEEDSDSETKVPTKKAKKPKKKVPGSKK